MSHQPVVVITGASSGIGKTAAIHFRKSGWTVYAGARRIQQMDGLRVLGCHVLPLDVTNEDSRQTFVRQVLDTAGQIDVLVNNAGFGPLGPVEVYDPAEMQRVFDTNVFGLVRLSQLVLPHMRARRQGRIIHIGSMGGDFTTPYAGVYHASKYAVESLSDAMRYEVKPFGIDVVLVKPAAVDTPLAHDTMKGGYGFDGVYRPYMQAMQDVSQKSLANGNALIQPEAVAKAIFRAATTKRPQARYQVGLQARILPFLRRWLPIRMWDGMWRMMIKPKPVAASASRLANA